jgi:hypothetical protein
MLIQDCGKVSAMTHGQVNELFTEVGTPPFNKWHGCCIGESDQKPPEPVDPMDLSDFKEGLEP